MSHVISINAELKDLAAVKAACTELGLIFNENKKTIRWFGQWVNDYDAEDAAYKLGIRTDQYGTSDHSISVKGCSYDIGLLKNPETGAYKIYFDFFGSEGRKLQRAIGPNGGKLVQHYAANVATKAAQAKGYTVFRQTTPNGKIKLTVNGF